MPRSDETGASWLVERGALEHYEDAELYDHEYRRRRADVSWYVAYAKGAKRILELGCGTGRLTIALARAGHEVVAIDSSETMLARLQQRLDRAPAAIRARVTLRRANLIDFALGEKFDLIVSAFNVLEHLYTRVELAACLARVDAHLAPRGRFTFDVQMPDLVWLTRDPNKRWARTRFTHPRTGQKLWYSTNHDYDPVSQIALIRLFYDPVDGTPGHVVMLSQRKYFPAELEALCANSGFATVERYGDFAGAPLSGAADSQVLVCMRQREFLDGNRASGSKKPSTGARSPSRKSTSGRNLRRR
jgi:SAM-dependent methyltransferase